MIVIVFIRLTGSQWLANTDPVTLFLKMIVQLTMFEVKMGTNAMGATITNNAETIHPWVF